MRWRRALRAKILTRLDQPDAEQLFPEAIHGNARCQRVLRIDQPTGDCESVGRNPFRQRGECRRDTRRNHFAQAAKIAPNLDLRHSSLVIGQLPHHRRRNRLRVSQVILLQRGRFIRSIGVQRIVPYRQKAVVLLLRNRIVFVGVALCATHRQSHPHLHRRIHSIDDGRHPEFFIVRSSFAVGHRVAVKRRGQLLLRRRLRQQVARQLLDRELVEWHVPIPGIDHPIAIPPDDARRILRVASGVGVSGQIQPHPRPMFTESGRLQ